MISSPTLSPLDYQLQLPNQRKILAIYAVALLMYTVASPDPDPNPRGGRQLLNPNECNSTLTSETKNIYPYPYIDVNDRGHRLRSGSPVTNYPCATSWYPLAIYSQVFTNSEFPLDRACKHNSRPWLFQKINYPCLANLILLLGNAKLITREM